MRVARQTIELRDHQRAAQPTRVGHRGQELGPFIIAAGSQSR